MTLTAAATASLTSASRVPARPGSGAWFDERALQLLHRQRIEV
jgi:hypothetical protein